MAKFVLSAFADEYSPEIDKQIEGLKANGIGMLEIRGVDGTNIADISEEKAREVKAKFDANGIKVSCIGSPIGKIKISVDIVVSVGKALIPTADSVTLFGFVIVGFDLPESVVCLGIDEVKSAFIQRIADVVIKRIGIEIAVNSRYRNQHGIGMRFMAQNAVKHNAALGRHPNFFTHNYLLNTHL